MAAMVLVSNVLAQERERMPPKLEQVMCIYISSAHTHWTGYFYPNGSAKLQHGTGNPIGVGIAQEGSFSFEEIYRLLIPCVKQDFNIGAAKWPVTVSFSVANPTRPSSWYLIPELYPADKEVMGMLMHRLRDKVVPVNSPLSTQAVFENALNKHPLVPGDKPTPVVYNKSLSGSEYLAADADVGGQGMWLSFVETEDGNGKIVRHIQTNYTAYGMKLKIQREEGNNSMKMKDESPVGDFGASPVIVNESETTEQSCLWLYGGILAALCAGVAFWLIRRKKGSPS